MAYKIEHNRQGCIQCGACAAIAPHFWVMADDGFSDLVGSKKRADGWEELDVAEKNFEENSEAAESCPVNVIHIMDKVSGKKII